MEIGSYVIELGSARTSMYNVQLAGLGVVELNYVSLALSGCSSIVTLLTGPIDEGLAER
jgi:hypothetical protein